MENRASTKIIEISDKKYQISKMDPRTVCWLFSFLGSRSENNDVTSSLGRCSREEFNEIQDLALKHTFFMDERDGSTFPTAVISPKGTWADKDLENDASAVFNILIKFILFNLEPFLEGSGSRSQK